ncbi:MAG: hypothetical protein ABIG63_01575 [Chloroflexota bacterium]
MGLWEFPWKEAGVGPNPCKSQRALFIKKSEVSMYIDPNSGGLLFQALLIMFGVISGTVLIFSSKIKMGFSKLRRSFREKSKSDELSETPTEEKPKN